MHCEKCGSENTQRLQMIYDGGTQDINATSHTAGVGSISGALGLSGSVTKTAGTSRSVLAQKAAPPEKRTMKALIILTLAGFFCLQGRLGVAIVGMLMIGIGSGGIYKAIQFNTQQWPSLYRRWLDSWMCQKCGHSYHQRDTGALAEVNHSRSLSE